MSRTNTGATGNYFTLSSAPVTAAPLTVAAWVFVSANGFRAVSIHGATNNSWRLGPAGSGVLGWTARNSAAPPGSANTANTTSIGAWNHFVGIEVAANDRISVLNGDWTQRGLNGANRAPIVTDMIVGRNDDAGEHMNARIAWLTIWNIALVRGEVEALAAGLSPFQVKPAKIVESWDFTGASDANEVGRVAGSVLTEVGNMGTAESRHLAFDTGAIGQQGFEADLLNLRPRHMYDFRRRRVA